MNRILCIWLPRWPIQRLVVGQQVPKGQPIILHQVVARRGQLVVACSETARQRGVQTGMSLTEAMAVAMECDPPPQTHRSQPVQQQKPVQQQEPVDKRQRDGPAASLSSSACYVAQHHREEDDRVLCELAEWCEQFGPIVGFTDRPLCDSALCDSPLCDSASQASPERSTNRSSRDQETEPFNSSNDCLYLDCTHLGAHYGGEDRLLHRVTAALDRRGYHVRTALADTLGAAWAAAHFLARPNAVGGSTITGQLPAAHRSCYALLAPGGSFAALEAAPIAALRLPATTLASLQQLGIEQVGQLACLPRSGLAGRLGKTLLIRWDQAFGTFPEPLHIHHSSVRYEARWTAEHPTRHPEHLHQILVNLTRQLCNQMTEHDRTVLVLRGDMRCRRDGDLRSEYPPTAGTAQPASWDGESFNGAFTTQTFRIGLFQPTALVDPLMELIDLQLAQLTLAGDVEQITLTATQTTPRQRRQGELFAGGPRRVSDCLAKLMNRLSVRLGPSAVVRPRWLPGADPQRVWVDQCLTGHRLPASTASSARAGKWSSAQSRGMVRPLRFYASAERLQVRTESPQGPPVSLDFQRCRARVVRYWGPERIETGWWRGRSVCRDYYRVEIDTGCWLWIFRQHHDQQWYLQGLFD